MRQRIFLIFIEFGAKFRTKIDLLSLTKFRKKILPSRNLLNQKKIEAYGSTRLYLDQIQVKKQTFKNTS